MPLTPHVEHHFTASAIVRDIVIGMSDGLTVPFAMAAGVWGEVDSTALVVTAGVAEIAAGAIAMGLGGYLAGKSDLEHYIRERAREEIEIAEKPEVEAEEVRELLQSHGLTAEESAPVVDALRRRPEAWRDFMMRFELWREKPDPARARTRALADGRGAGDEGGPAAGVGEDVGAEPANPARGRGIEHLADEDRAEPSALPAVLDDERDLDRVRLVGRLVASDPDDLDAVGAVVLGDEREPPAVVHPGQDLCPIGRQPLHDREEAVVGGIAAEPAVELLEPRRVLWTDRTDVDIGAVPELDVLDELPRVLGWRGHANDSNLLFQRLSGAPQRGRSHRPNPS